MHEILPTLPRRIHPYIAGESTFAPVSPDLFNLHRISARASCFYGASSRISFGVLSSSWFHEIRSSENHAHICSMNERSENGTACTKLPSGGRMPGSLKQVMTIQQPATE